jgi:hypothetical protein
MCWVPVPVISACTDSVPIDDGEDPGIRHVAVLSRCATAKFLFQLIASRRTEGADGICSDLTRRLSAVTIVLRMNSGSNWDSCRVLMAAHMRWVDATWHTVILWHEVHGFLLRWTTESAGYLGVFDVARRAR